MSAAFAVAAMTPRHFYVILTKRPERFLEWRRFAEREASIFTPENRMLQYVCHEASKIDGPDLLLGQDAYENPVPWPPPNVALGVTVESQEHVGRVGTLLQAWPGLTFVSHEPGLGLVDLTEVYVTLPDTGSIICGTVLGSDGTRFSPGGASGRGVDLVICGGESGPSARPMHPDWARSLRDQCKSAGVPYMLKQWGEWLPKSHAKLLGISCPKRWGTITADGTFFEDATPWNGHDDDGAGEAVMYRVGSKRAGRLLDGREHNGWFGETT
jgi:protein gp37